MPAQLRWFWAWLNANYWFYPTMFSIAAAVLAFTCVWLDRNGLAEWLNNVPEIAPARPDGASNMLSVIASSMIGVASTVFSITIAAVAYASGTYGPRLLTNFMEDKGNQLSLATFIGTFVYAITVLRSVRAEGEAPANAAEAAADALPGFVPQLSLSVAYVLMAISVAVLVYFLNHIPASIRINTVLEGIGRRLLKQVCEEFPEGGRSGEPGAPPDGRPVFARAAGYIQIIDFNELSELADKQGYEIALKVRTGDFVHPGMALAHVAGGDPPHGPDSETIHDAFKLGATRSSTQDPDFLIDELVEIALRALSPGINDPFTAINALHWLGAATATLGTRDLRKRARDDAGGRRVFPLPDGFAHYVERGFGTARSAVATSAPAALVALDTIQNAAAVLESRERRALLEEEGGRLMAQARLALNGPDLAGVEARYEAFKQAF